jgi:hypothetical protein
MTNRLITEPNLDAPDDFYEALIEAHAGLETAQSHELNAKLVLLLANHVGSLAVLREALAAARANTLGEPAASASPPRVDDARGAAAGATPSPSSRDAS